VSFLSLLQLADNDRSTPGASDAGRKDTRAQIKEMMKKRKLNSSQPAPVSYESETLLDAVTREVDCFYKQSIDWKETLVRQGVDVSGATDDDFCDVFWIAKRFNPVLWYEATGLTAFRYVSLVAPVVLGKQGTNGYQERVFSRSTFVDHPLRRSMQDPMFEMNVLLAVNDSFIEEHKGRKPRDFSEAMKDALEFFHGKGVDVDEFSAQLLEDGDDDGKGGDGDDGDDEGVVDSLVGATEAE